MSVFGMAQFWENGAIFSAGLCRECILAIYIWQVAQI